MSDHLLFAYRPDGFKVQSDNLNILLKLTCGRDPIWGWLNTYDEQTGRFQRRLSHRVANAEIRRSELLLSLAPAPAAAGQLLRRLYDEDKPLAIVPLLSGSTDDAGRWDWDSARVIAWDVHLVPGYDSELDRIVRAIQKGTRNRRG